MPALPRALQRKRVVVPVATVLVAVTGFVGYGAYTRSKPITYSRGGNEFAVVSPGGPVAGGHPQPQHQRGPPAGYDGNSRSRGDGRSTGAECGTHRRTGA